MLASVFRPSLQAYADLVTVGQYLIVEDTRLDRTLYRQTKPGPMSAVKKFLAKPERSSMYTADRSKEVGLSM